MAKTQTGSQKPALTRGKAVLIGVLSIVLITVLYVQYGRYAGDSDAGAEATASKRAPVGKAVRPATMATAEPRAETDAITQAALLAFDQAKWRPPELSKVISYDPFALPAGFPEPSAPGGLNVVNGDVVTAEEKSKQLADALAELRMQLDELKERGVHVIVGQKDEYVAVIGDRMIRVGDQINEFTVTEIDPKDGVRVEWKGPE